MKEGFCVLYKDAAEREQAAALAATLMLPLQNIQATESESWIFALRYSPKGLSLQMAQLATATPVLADFSSPGLSYRVRDAVHKQAIAKAVGIKPGVTPSIFDATAGLGKDAFLLASMGCSVVMIERNKAVHALLQDAVQRAMQSSDSRIAEAAARLTLQNIDFRHLLTTTVQAEVVYLDPMFPKRQKTARVKKDMFVLQEFMNYMQELDSNEGLLAAALKIATRRVVVKRSRYAGFLDECQPSYSLSGSSSRYDIYLTSSLPNKSW